MAGENTNTTKDKESTFDNLVQFLVKESKKITKENFAIYSTIAAVIYSVILWCIKSIWYAYWSGRFWVYKIDRCYIDTGSEKAFLQIIQWVLLFVVWLIINYIYYMILVSEDVTRFHWKRKIKCFLFYIVEMATILEIALVSSNTKFQELVNEITARNFLPTLILIIILCFIIDIFAIQFAIEERLKRKKLKEATVQKNAKMTNEQRIKIILIVWSIALVLGIGFAFLQSKNNEESRCRYKVIMIPSEEEAESEFDIEYLRDNNKYKICPVAYENQDCYIVTRLYNEDGKIKIDYNYQKILNKDEYETIYLDDVYQISTGK